MHETALAYDFSGRELCKGDVVSTLSGSVTGRISQIALDDETVFVRVRPMHQSYGRGMWHAADRVVHVSSPRKKKDG